MGSMANVCCQGGDLSCAVQAAEAGQSRCSPLLRRPVRTQSVIDQSDMYTHVLSALTEKKVSDCRQLLWTEGLGTDPWKGLRKLGLRTAGYSGRTHVGN